MIGRHIFFICIISFIGLNLKAQSKRFGIDEHLGAQLPLDAQLIDARDSSIVTLGDLLDKPVILSFVYYKCPGLCTPIMSGIAEVIDLMDLIPGKDYKVITISIDYNETPRLARQKKDSLFSTLKKANEAKNSWLFFTADSINISRLTSAAGYEFKRENNHFVHAAATILLSPQGKISQYFYGTYFLPMHLKMGITNARHGKTTPTRIKDLKYCYNFTPPENQLVRLVVVAFGSIIVAISFALFIILTFRKKKTKSFPLGEEGKGD